MSPSAIIPAAFPGTYQIGPYTFSLTDARKTVQLKDYLWAQFVLGRDAAAIEHLTPRLVSTGDPVGDLAINLRVVWDALLAAGIALRAAGQLPPTATGIVTHLAAADGGVPKRGVDRVEVGWRGVVGDGQAHRQHHGRPWQALCIWSDEVIADFRSAGHPIFPGAAGENITISGIDWALVRPGVRLQIGSVLCEISAFAEPCSQNARWFADGDFGLMDKDRGPSRAYATILGPGGIRVGDAAILEP